LKQNLALILMAFFLLAAAMGSANTSGSRSITSNGGIVGVTAASGTEVKFSLTKLDQTIFSIRDIYSDLAKVSTLLGALGYASSSLASTINEDEDPGDQGKGKVKVSDNEDEDPGDQGKGKVKVSESPTLLLLGIALLVIAALRLRRVS
jgi:hypothetical protein